MAQFAVIGLGSFGATAARELMRLGHDVIGIDREAKFVDGIASDITYAAIADATDEHVLRELNIENCDAVLVAIGENIEASILCVVHLKTLGIAKVWVKAKSSSHHKILSHLGVDKIIHPEEDMGIRIAQALNYPMISRYMVLGDNHFIVAVDAAARLQGVCLCKMLEGYNGIRIVLLKRKDKVFYDIDPSLLLEEHDQIVVEGCLTDLNKLASKFSA